MSAATVLAVSPTMLDLEVAGSAPALPIADGPLPVRAIIDDDADEAVGEIIVWASAGLLIGIEQAWFTDEHPTQWPPPARVRLS